MNSLEKKGGDRDKKKRKSKDGFGNSQKLNSKDKRYLSGLGGGTEGALGGAYVGSKIYKAVENKLPVSPLVKKILNTPSVFIGKNGRIGYNSLAGIIGVGTGFTLGSKLGSKLGRVSYDLASGNKRKRK